MTSRSSWRVGLDGMASSALPMCSPSAAPATRPYRKPESFMTLLGQFALWAAFLIGLWSAVISFSGRWRDRPELAATVIRSVYAILGCLVVAALSLWKGLVTHDFNIEYVAAYTSRNLPPYFIVSALWAGQKGSLLFWATVLSIFASLAQLL